MNKSTIQYLAYLLDKAKTEGKDKAIVFLGAGASVSAGIPLTGVIVRHIKLKFRKNPIIKNAVLDGKSDYYVLMGALTADERRDLFHFYVTRDKVKLNMANVYLAQLLSLGYVDYIVTVNFDDLILKACTLYNFLPPVYDVSNIKTVTTTDIRTGSVLYLHGQYFGQWLLNNKEELEKVEAEVLSLFNSIKTRRTWIVVGYSGNDGIFDKIKSLGSFSNEFFWVKKALNPKEDKHVIEFLETPNNNAQVIEGYYADTFFLKLHAELSKLDEKLSPPDIFYKPFNHVKSIMQNVNEINGEDYLNKEVKNIIEICNDRIDKAIEQFENVDTIEGFKQKIIDSILKNEFNDELAITFENKIELKSFIEAKEQLSWYYNVWASQLLDLAKQESSAELYKESFQKYTKASELNPKNDAIYYNWGNALFDLAKQESSAELYKESFHKYTKASELNPKNDAIYNNWGTALSDLAKQESSAELYKESFQKYTKASELNPKDDAIYYNWGTALSDLAKQESSAELYKESFQKYTKASELNPKNDAIYINWGTALSNLAKQESSAELYKESFQKFEKASELNPKDDAIYNNWANALIGLFDLTGEQSLPQKALKLCQKAYVLGGSSYNLACTYALLRKKESALKYLEESLEKHFISEAYVKEDNDWADYLEDKDFKSLLAKYKNQD